MPRSHNLPDALKLALSEYQNGAKWVDACDKAAQKYNLGPLDHDWLISQKPAAKAPIKAKEAGQKEPNPN